MLGIAPPVGSKITVFVTFFHKSIDFIDCCHTGAYTHTHTPSIKLIFGFILEDVVYHCWPVADFSDIKEMQTLALRGKFNTAGLSLL